MIIFKNVFKPKAPAIQELNTLFTLEFPNTGHDNATKNKLSYKQLYFLDRHFWMKTKWQQSAKMKIKHVFLSVI